MDDKVKNIGLIYYKDIYQYNTEIFSKSIKEDFVNKDNIDKIILGNINLSKYEKYNPVLENDTEKITEIYLKTTYPGLLIGSGYNYGIGAKEEFKVGFDFDYITGLPVLRGSAIKGILREIFERLNNDKEFDFVYSYLIENLNIKENNYLKNKIDKEDKKKEILKIKDYIFEGIDYSKINDKNSYLPSYKRFKFLDAYAYDSKKEDKKLFEEDYMTPHIKYKKNDKNEKGIDKYSRFKNPIPIKFLKVKENVEFKFQFILQDYIYESLIIKKENFENLFKNILIDFGLGAKRNYNYGSFEKTDKQKELDDKKIEENKAEEKLFDIYEKLSKYKNKTYYSNDESNEHLFDKLKKLIEEDEKIINKDIHPSVEDVVKIFLQKIKKYKKSRDENGNKVEYSVFKELTEIYEKYGF
jgi:CRISPR-associated protein Cmr6